MLASIGILLICFWIFITTLKFFSVIDFSEIKYIQLLFGKKSWYKTNRNIILALGLILLICFGEIEIIYYSLIITSLYGMSMFLYLFFNDKGNMKLNILYTCSCLFLGVIFSYLLSLLN